MEHVLVVGGGTAGLYSVVALRDQGFAGRVTVLGAEPRRPYDRPPLSKGVLLGTTDDPSYPLDLDELGARTRLGERAVSLEPGARVVRTDAGAELSYDGLVIATGSRPVTLRGAPGSGTTLRTLDDAMALREALAQRPRLAIVGAGWIAGEVATAATAAGCEVVVVEAGGQPLATVLPAEIGERLRPWYRDAGALLRTGVTVEAVRPEGLLLAGGETLSADRVLVAVGARPDTAWLRDCPGLRLRADGAVEVDAGLRASLPDTVAVGDCAAYASRRYGQLIRVEHWDNALRGPAVAVTSLLGGEAVHDPVPYVWSDQFGHTLLYAGRHATGDRLVMRESATEPGWSACWLTAAAGGQRLTAVLAVDRPRDLAQSRRLIEANTIVDPERVKDPATPLRAAAL